MGETILVAVAVLLAAACVFRWTRKTVKGEGHCACGKRPGNCCGNKTACGQH